MTSKILNPTPPLYSQNVFTSCVRMFPSLHILDLLMDPFFLMSQPWLWTKLESQHELFWKWKMFSGLNIHMMNVFKKFYKGLWIIFPLLILNLSPKNVILLLLFYSYFEEFKSIKKIIMKCYKEIGHNELIFFDPIRFCHKEKKLHSKFHKIYFVLKKWRSCLIHHSFTLICQWIFIHKTKKMLI